MDVLFCILFIALCFFLGWQCCLLYLTLKNKKKVKLADPVQFTYGGHVHKAIFNARNEMKGK